MGKEDQFREAHSAEHTAQNEPKNITGRKERTWRALVPQPALVGEGVLALSYQHRTQEEGKQRTSGCPGALLLFFK